MAIEYFRDYLLVVGADIEEASDFASDVMKGGSPELTLKADAIGAFNGSLNDFGMRRPGDRSYGNTVTGDPQYDQAWTHNPDLSVTFRMLGAHSASVDFERDIQTRTKHSSLAVTKISFGVGKLSVRGDIDIPRASDDFTGEVQAGLTKETRLVLGWPRQTASRQRDNWYMLRSEKISAPDYHQDAAA